MLTEEQVAERLNGLGGSDVGAVVGLNPYSTRHDVYNQKRGLVPPFTGNAATEVGDALEPAILAWFERATGFKLDTENVTRRHPTEDWMLATVDGLVMDNDGKPVAIVEAKTASWRMADKWGPNGSDIVPTHYYIQCVWYMAVLDLPVAYVAALVDREFRLYKIERDVDIEKKVVDEAREFWFENVVAGIAPEPDSSDGCSERLALSHHADAVAYLTEEDDKEGKLSDIMREWSKAKDAEKEAKARADECRNRLATIVGDDFKGFKCELGTASWTHPKAKAEVDWEAIARKLGATQEDVNEHTKTKTRNPFMVPRFKNGGE